MNTALKHSLDQLPPLSSGAGAAMSEACKICGASAPLFDVVDFHKHCSFGKQYAFGLSGIQVPYHRCGHCGFLFTRFFDDWQPAAFARYIYNADYVQVDPEYTGARPRRLAVVMTRALRGCEELRILDYGSGSGIFAAEMRAAGFSRIEAYDPFSSPSHPAGKFDLVTCFEALEHMVWPEAAFAAMQDCLLPGGCILFSQSIQPPDINDIRGAWWYLAPRNGHISMFTAETLMHFLPSSAHVLHGNDWLWAIAPETPQPTLAPCISAIGPAIFSATLTAPALGGQDSWHAEEVCAAGRFRWSKSDRLEWVLASPQRGPVRVTVRLPFRLEIEPGFTGGCSVEIGGMTAHVTVRGHDIIAEAMVEGSPKPLVVTMRTPQTRSPFDLRGAPDARRLGLAMVSEHRALTGVMG